MAEKNYAYSRGVVGYPTIVLAVCWLGVWLLWPQVKLPVSRHNLEMSSPIAYVQLENADALAHKSPIVFARPSRIGFFPETSDLMPDETLAPGPITVAPQYLELPKTLIDRPAVLRGIASTVGLSLGRYRPVWPRAGAAARPERELKLLVETSSSLKECGFQIADGLDGKLAGLGRSLQVTAEVDILNDGRVEHVFIVNSSGDKAIDRLVVRSLEQGSVLQKGKSRAGRVTVSFGQ